MLVWIRSLKQVVRVLGSFLPKLFVYLMSLSRGQLLTTTACTDAERRLVGRSGRARRHSEPVALPISHCGLLYFLLSCRLWHHSLRVFSHHWLRSLTTDSCERIIAEKIHILGLIHKVGLVALDDGHILDSLLVFHWLLLWHDTLVKERVLAIGCLLSRGGGGHLRIATSAEAHEQLSRRGRQARLQRIQHRLLPGLLLLLLLLHR